ncbi:polyadenylate-binding protein 3 isoform X2 [Girardinichthys multiradiatus]|uniref:polyadenylate-binding protein 3 isoform X2 n=1 Tax=Girardinichthys multiradiatus TaxID=208333 RepID=UPI001FAD8A65|nr:polyadenylate-binding protein 3 isoform X2 [Girardinichthys multiradiatus]
MDVIKMILHHRDDTVEILCHFETVILVTKPLFYTTANEVAHKANDVPESSDSLGEQLFELVDVYNTGHSQKITGMLLEQHKEAVLQLLSDPKLLEEHVNLALKTLKEQNIEETDLSDASEADETDRLGEKLFSLVEQMDPLHANDITGMLLEMDSASLKQLLSDHTKLEVAVQKAQAVLDTES